MDRLVEPYTSFAVVYDHMMHNVDYVRWADYIHKLFMYYDLHPKRILNVACGTGSIDVLLAQKGYKVYGMDIALPMLLRAVEKAKSHGVQLVLWQQDMRYLTVSKPFDAILCLYDSINYITTKEDMVRVFLNVSRALVPKGVFIFDITTEYNIVKYFNRQTYAESYDEYSYIWKNFYLPHEKICKTILTFFLKENDHYRKYEELHIQRIYSVSEIKDMLNDCGFKLLSAFDAFTFNKNNKESERVNFTAVKKE